MTANDTRQTILDAARATVQARGYNALSFRELAKEVGVKSASIHYHFPTKGDLGAALARRYTDDAAEAFDDLLAKSSSPKACIGGYTKIFRAALLNNNRMCLCGIMAAEREDLPAEVRIEVDRFTDVNIKWLVKVLSLQKSPTDENAVQQRALGIFTAIQGAQLAARGRGDIVIFDSAVAAYQAAGLFP